MKVFQVILRKKMFEYETFLEIKRIVSIKKYGSAAALLIGFAEQSSIKKVSHCLSKDFLSIAVTYFVPKFNDDQLLLSNQSRS